MSNTVILSPLFGRRTSAFRGEVVNEVNYGGSSPKVRAQNDSADECSAVFCFPPTAYRLLSTANCLLPTAIFQSLVPLRFVHIDENATVGDFHKLGRIAIFADHGIGGFNG
jgi:hypothetical protein